MKSKFNRRKRADDIVKLLIEHGPLSFKTIEAMLNPPMKLKKLKKSLYLLRDKKIIRNTRYVGLKTFFHIQQSQENLKNLAQKFHICADQIIDVGVNEREWLHNEICEYWIHLLKMQFPNSKIIRERDFGHTIEAQEVMLIKNGEYYLRPDFLFILPKQHEKQDLVIAFEIERSRKSKIRIVEKLSKYADKSLVDGVFYVCSNLYILKSISVLFQNNFMKKSLRVRHYGEKFLMLTDNFSTTARLNDMHFNAALKPSNFLDWICYLKNTEHHLRKNKIESEGTIGPLRNEGLKLHVEN